MQPLATALASHCRLWGEQLESDSNCRAGRAEFVFPADYAAFQGHFPGNPILPAVIQLAAVRFLARLLTGEPLLVLGFYRVKFRGVILPDEPVELFLELEHHDCQWSASFSWQQLEGECRQLSRGRCRFSSGSDDQH